MRPHYVLVEIRRDEDVGTIRKAIHACYPDVSMGDIIIRGDRLLSYYGLPIKKDYDALSEIFERHMRSAKETNGVTE